MIFYTVGAFMLIEGADDNLASTDGCRCAALPSPGPAKEASRPVATEIVPTQPVAMPPVVPALTADFEAGRAAAEAARAAYLAERRQSQS